jgi:hypothetical protein
MPQLPETPEERIKHNYWAWFIVLSACILIIGTVVLIFLQPPAPKTVVEYKPIRGGRIVDTFTQGVCLDLLARYDPNVVRASFLTETGPQQGRQLLINRSSGENDERTTTVWIDPTTGRALSCEQLRFSLHSAIPDVPVFNCTNASARFKIERSKEYFHVVKEYAYKASVLQSALAENFKLQIPAPAEDYDVYITLISYQNAAVHNFDLTLASLASSLADANCSIPAPIESYVVEKS